MNKRMTRSILAVTTAALIAACGNGKSSGRASGGQGGDPGGGDDAPPLIPPASAPPPSVGVDTPAPGGGGRNFYVGVVGTCPPAGRPALNGGACLASLDGVPWGEAAGAHARLAAGDTVYVSRDSSPYHVKFNVSGQGTADQWIRVHGMLGPSGERPVIDGIGATTAPHSRYRATVEPWLRLQQGQGVIHVSAAAGDTEAPRHVEIANLDVHGARVENTFVASNGATHPYGGGSYGDAPQQPLGAIVTVSARDILIRNCALHDSAEAFYDWTGGGALGDPDGGAAGRHTLRGNAFYGCGVAGYERRHATYTECLDGIVYEFNYFGPMIPGATGNQLRDRSGGTIVRYNWIEAPPGGAYAIDLMEPEESASAIVSSTLYAHDHVYGNVLVNRLARSGSVDRAFVHWSENNGVEDRGVYPRYRGHIGRTDVPDARLHFYQNTILVEADYEDDYHTPMLLNWAEQSECPSSARSAVTDVRNNLVVLLPQTGGGRVPPWYWERCGDANLNMGVNWLTATPASQWWEPWGSETTYTGALVHDPAAGGTTIVGSGDPFVSQASGNLRPAPGAATVVGRAGPLSPALAAGSNPWGADLTPVYQLVGASPGGVTVEPRAERTDLGAIQH